MIVICEKYKSGECVSPCIHASEHEPLDDLEGAKCTETDECVMHGDVKCMPCQLNKKCI